MEEVFWKPAEWTAECPKCCTVFWYWDNAEKVLSCKCGCTFLAKCN